MGMGLVRQSLPYRRETNLDSASMAVGGWHCKMPVADF
jgi:hypothetical protein